MSTEATQDTRTQFNNANIATFTGQIQSQTKTGFMVVINGNALPAFCGSGYAPQIAESVLVLFISGAAFVMAPATPNPTQGTVVSVAAGLVTLTTSVAGVTGKVICPYSNNITPTAGQVLELTYNNGPFATAVISTTAVTPTPPPTPPPTKSQHVDVFTALDSGTWNGSSWWTREVYASSSNVGAWFYGTKISDTIPASAQVQRIEVFISAIQITGSNPNFATHTSQSQPGGSPAYSNITALGVSGGWVTLPNSFATALQAGGGAFGVGVDHGGFSIFKSVQQDGQSGALRITSVY